MSKGAGGLDHGNITRSEESVRSVDLKAIYLQEKDGLEEQDNRYRQQALSIQEKANKQDMQEETAAFPPG